METERKVTVEPAGRTEADWSSAPQSSTGLPKFVEDDFRRMIKVREEFSEEGEAEVAEEESGEGDASGEGADVLSGGDVSEEGAVDQDDDATAQLTYHMAALLDKGGKERDRQTMIEELIDVFRRFTPRMPGN